MHAHFNKAPNAVSLTEEKKRDKSRDLCVGMLLNTDVYPVSDPYVDQERSSEFHH